MVCSNFRDVTVLRFPEEIYLRILEKNVSPLVKSWIQKKNVAFVPVVEHLRLFKDTWKVVQPVFICFVHFKNVFKCIP